MIDLPESENKNLAEKKTEIKEVMKDLHQIHNQITKPKKVVRLGKYQQGKCRPMKVYWALQDINHQSSINTS